MRTKSPIERFAPMVLGLIVVALIIWAAFSYLPGLFDVQALTTPRY